MVDVEVIIFAGVAILIFLGILLHLAKESGRNEGSGIIGRLEKEAEILRTTIDVQQNEVASLTDKITVLADEVKKTVSQKKSSEVRTGMIAEQMAPFLAGFPYDHSKSTLLFLGAPIDFLAIDSDGVHFVEVKSGNSQLNKNQRRFKEHIENKNVTFEVYRIKGK